MMAELVKIPFEGGFADAEPVDFKMPGPVSVSHTLPDGKVLKVDMSISDLFQLVDKKDAQGEPVYVFNVQVKVVTLKAEGA